MSFGRGLHEVLSIMMHIDSNVKQIKLYSVALSTQYDDSVCYFWPPMMRFQKYGVFVVS